MTLSVIDGDVFLYMSMWGCDTLKEAQDKFNLVLEENLESTFSTDYCMAFGGPNNFRVDLHPGYKGHRKKNAKADWFDDLKLWASELPGSHLCDGFEADDLVRIWALEADAAGKDRVVITVDKDLDCIPGNHWNPRKRELYKVEESYAEYFYWKQVLMGDSVDAIPGIPKCGPVKADKLLYGLTDHKELKAAVCRAYHAHYGEDGYEAMIWNGRLIHIWRFMDDHFKVKRESYDQAIKG
jgi:DNA polymerase-1